MWVPECVFVSLCCPMSFGHSTSVNIQSFWSGGGGAWKEKWTYVSSRTECLESILWGGGGSTETTWYQTESKFLQLNYSCNLLHLYADLGKKKPFLFSQPITATIIQFYARHDWLTNTAAPTLQSGVLKLNLTELAVLWRDFMQLKSCSHIMGLLKTTLLVYSEGYW